MGKISLQLNDNEKGRIFYYGNVYAKIIDIYYVGNSEYIKAMAILEEKEDGEFDGFELRNGYKAKGPLCFTSLTMSWIKKKSIKSINFLLARLRSIAIECGVYEDFKKLDNKYDTIEEFINGFKELDIYDKYLYWAIGAKYEISSSGYGKHYPFLLDNENGLYIVTRTKDMLLPFDKSKHIIKKDKTVMKTVYDNNNNLPDFLLNNNADNDISSNIANNISNDMPDTFIPENNNNAFSNEELPF